jgi:hypothetical protein
VNLLELATAEKAAAERRSVAEAVWRSKWWQTTVAIGELPINGVGKQLEAIAPVLGVSTSYLASRRRLGAKIALQDEELLGKVPPRLAIEYVKADRRLDVEGALFLIRWESDERSLRELATELGTAGRSWATREQLDEREAAAKPTVEQIRAALADPETAREVVAHGPTRAAFQGATDHWARETTSGTHWTPPPTNAVHDDRLAQLTGDLMRARELVAEAHRLSADLPFDDEVATGTIQRLEAVIAEAVAMRDSLARHVTFSGQLEQLGGVR